MSCLNKADLISDSLSRVTPQPSRNDYKVTGILPCEHVLITIDTDSVFSRVDIHDRFFNMSNFVLDMLEGHRYA